MQNAKQNALLAQDARDRARNKLINAFKLANIDVLHAIQHLPLVQARIAQASATKRNKAIKFRILQACLLQPVTNDDIVVHAAQFKEFHTAHAYLRKHNIMHNAIVISV